VEGHRYAADEPSWYPGQPEVSGSHAIGNPYDSGIHERPSGAFRLPDQRPGGANPYASADPLAAPASHARPAEAEVRVPIRGPEYPTIRPTGSSAESAPAIGQPTTLVPPVAAPERVYQTRRPVTSFLVAIVMVVLLVPVVRLLFAETFAGDPTARGIVPAVLLTLGFTLTGIGLFSVARAGTIGRESWLRPPVAYLPVGLVLLLAAGFAVA
jgi:hypothetical protein